MQVPHSEGVANHTVLESCVAYREMRREALTEVRIGQPLSRERFFQGADVFSTAEGNTVRSAIASFVPALRGLRPWHVRTLLIWMPPFVQVDLTFSFLRSKCCLISGLLCRIFLLALMKSAGRGLILFTSS